MTNTRVAELINQNNFIDILKNELYSLIDEELAKDIEMDCDLIDELVNAIEALEQCEDENPAVVLPLIFADGTILSKRIRNKVNGKKTLVRITALAAAFAMIISGANQIPTTEGKSVLVYAVDEILEGIGEIFGIKNLLEKDETPVIPEIEETTTIPQDVEEEIIEQNNSTTTDVQSRMISLNLITYSNFKTSYLWKEELDLTGLKVVAVYSDDTEKTIPVSDCEISGFNSLKIGEQTITVKYKGLSAQFKVTVSKTEQNNEATRKITNIECKAGEKDIVVPKGTENPALAKKVEYRYVYSDGTFSPWTVCKDAELISKYDSQLIDIPQTLTYQTPNGMTFTINVIVYDNTVPEEKTVKKLEVYKAPTGMKHYASNYDQYYMYVDDKCDFSEFKIKVYFSDNTTETKTLGDSEIKTFGTMSTERPSSYSGYTITFAYGDVTTTFKYDVIIKSKIHSYSINDRIWQTYYISNAPEEFPMTNVVSARMNDANQDVYLDVEVKGYDPNKLGFIELELYYEGEYLCDYVGGYIYGDTGYAVIERPITDGIANAPLNFRPYVVVAKCVGDGKFETYADIKYEIDDNPINDPTVNLSSGTDSELQAMGITSFSCVCVDSSTVTYRISADDYITEFGTHEAKVYLYNVEPVYGKYNYVERWERTDIAEDLSYTITIKEKPSYYQVEAPKNLKINIQDIYSEFYDKLHVYAYYKDGRKEEIFDYNVKRYLPSRPTTSACLPVYVTYPNGNGLTVKLCVYSEGYEDSFFINLEDTRKEYDNYYSVGTAKPSVQIDFASAEQSQIDYVSTTSISSYDIKKWDIEGWDTSTPGEKEATIIYHSPIGDLKATYKYFVIPEYLSRTCTVVFNDENAGFDRRYGLIDGTYKVFHTDKVGRTYEITDYTVTYPTSTTGYGKPIISYWNPDPNVNSDSSNPSMDGYYPEMKIVGDCANLKAETLENGDIKITLDCLIYPENGSMRFKVGYPAEKGSSGGSKMEYIYSETPEIIISPDMIRPDFTTTFFYVYADIVDDETGKEYRTFSGEIKSYPLNR